MSLINKIKLREFLEENNISLMDIHRESKRINEVVSYNTLLNVKNGNRDAACTISSLNKILNALTSILDRDVNFSDILE